VERVPEWEESPHPHPYLFGKSAQAAENKEVIAKFGGLRCEKRGPRVRKTLIQRELQERTRTKKGASCGRD